MSEHLRKNGYQWVDGEVFIVWDKYHDQPDRLGGVGAGVYGSLKEALDWASHKEGWQDRTVILKVPAIIPYKLP